MNFAYEALDRLGEAGNRVARILPLSSQLGPVLIAAWLVAITTVKIYSYYVGMVTSDVFLYANALVNTRFPGQILYVADYQLRNGIKSLVFDHFEPSTVLFLPLFRIFQSPICLVVFEALAPLVLVICLVVLAVRLTGRAWPGWAVGVLTLFNPSFLDAVIDGPGRFHHDSLFMIFGPLFLTCFVLRKWIWACVFLLLFLGVKEDAAFFAAAFGMAVAIFGLPSDAHRRAGLAVGVLSIAYFLLTVVIAPVLDHTPNIYAAQGVASLHHSAVVSSAITNFVKFGWHKLLLYFYLSLGSPIFVVAVLPDLGMYSLMRRLADLWYVFCLVPFLAFGVLMTVHKLSSAPATAKWQQGRGVLLGAFALQLLICVPVGSWTLVHTWRKVHIESSPVPSADVEAAWRIVDRACAVAAANNLLGQFYRLPYYIQSYHVGSARYLVSTDRALLKPNATPDGVISFVDAHRPNLERVARFGPVTVWRNPGVPCLPWEHTVPGRERSDLPRRGDELSTGAAPPAD
jgi:uncharacterized membrane protein